MAFALEVISPAPAAKGAGDGARGKTIKAKSAPGASDSSSAPGEPELTQIGNIEWQT